MNTRPAPPARTPRARSSAGHAPFHPFPMAAILFATLLAGCTETPFLPDVEAGPGSIVGTVFDPFNSPLRSARVTVDGSGGFQSAVTGTAGDFRLDGVPAGSMTLTVSLGGFQEYQTSVSVASESESRVTVRLEPESLPSAGALATRVTSYSGSTMTFEVDAFVVDANARPIQGLGGASFQINDFSGVSFTPGGVTSVGGSGARSYSAALLLDQSGSITGTDPNDSRIVAAKTFLGSLGGSDNAVLAAFASGGMLPYDPLTIWGSGFTSNGAGYFGVLDQLASQESGGTPLYRSVASMIEYTSANATNQQRAVVVFTDGQDTDGGTSLDDVVALANQRNVPVYTVGLSSSVDVSVLSEMALRTGGAIMWAGDARQLVSAYKTLGGVLSGSLAYYRTRWTVRRTSGNWARGSWLTSSVTIQTPAGQLWAPFYVRIP